MNDLPAGGQPAVVHATIVRVWDGPARLCARPQGTDPPRCPDDAPTITGLHPTEEPDA